MLVQIYHKGDLLDALHVQHLVVLQFIVQNVLMDIIYRVVAVLIVTLNSLTLLFVHLHKFFNAKMTMILY